MTILVRDDRTQFVLQPYRELLTFRTAKLIIKEIRFLAQQNGQYVRLFKQKDRRYEAVFSRDPGCLLAESIWRYFNEPEELIYVEELPDHQNAVVVIVHKGAILFDAKLPLNSLIDELSSLLTLKTKFNIYLYGNVPIAQAAENDKVIFDEEHVLSFTRLQTSVVSEIDAHARLNLLPVEEAIAEQNFERNKIIASVCFAVVIISLLGGYAWYARTFTTVPVAKNPYSGYQSALRSPSPTKQLNELNNDCVQFYSMPGWVATHVNYNESGATVTVHSLGGTLTELLNWANGAGIQVKLTTHGAMLFMPTRIAERKTPTTIAPVTPTSAEIIDEMMQLFPGKSVAIESTHNHGVYKSIDLTITFSDIAPDILGLMGNALHQLPVQLKSISTQFNDGLLTGSVSIIVLGN